MLLKSFEFCRRLRLSGLLAFLTMVSTAFSQSPKPTFREIQDRIRSTTESVNLARLDTLIVTNEVLRSWLSVAKPTKYEKLSVEQIMALPGPELADVISSLGFYAMAQSDSLKQSDAISTTLLQMATDQRRRILRERFIQKEINEKNPPMTEEEARAWYKEHISSYTQPFTFTCRALFLSTDRPYRLRKGDTLQSIARSEIGDPFAINRILDSATSAPLFSPVAANAVSLFYNVMPSQGPLPRALGLLRFLPPFPPREGQLLWIPMKAPDRQAIRQRMEKIEAEVKAGADFDLLAKERSEDAPQDRGRMMGPLPLPGRPILQSVLDAVFQTPVGQVTPIIETPHGFLLLKVFEKTDQPVQPFKQVRDQIITEEIKQRRGRAFENMQESLVRDPILKIDREAIMNENAPESQVMARAGDFKYTWEDFRRDTGRRYSMPRTYETRVQLLEGSPQLREEILLAKARELGLDRDPAIRGQLDALDMVFRGRAYHEWYVLHKIPVGVEQLRKLYLDERDRYRYPGECSVRELVIKLEPDDLNDPKKIENVRA